jgi:hypothetical protein
MLVDGSRTSLTRVVEVAVLGASPMIGAGPLAIPRTVMQQRAACDLRLKAVLRRAERLLFS